MASRSDARTRSIFIVAGVLTAVWVVVLLLVARWLIEAIF
jgi:hypothetical protein